MDLLADAASRAERYLSTLDNRRAGPSPADVAALEALCGDLTDEGRSPEAVLEDLDRFGSPATMATAGGRFFGFVNGACHPAGLAASVLSAAWDQNAALAVMSPTAARLDSCAIGWVIDLLGLPSSSDGVFVTGATMASVTALAAGRDAVLASQGWNARDDGLVGAPPVTVVVGAEAHSTIFKGLGLLGLGRRNVVTVPVDDQGRMRTDELPEISGAMLVCLQAGNVNSGAFDPFGPLIDWAHDAGAWVHVDGAFGLWAAASPETRPLVVDVDRADSWASDGHKYLNTPYDCGIALVRDAETLSHSFGLDAAYLQSDGGRNVMFMSPDSSQRARGVEVWAVLSALGRRGVADLVERTCRHARRFAEGLRAAGFEVLNDVVLNQVMVSFGSDERTDEVIAAIQADGTCWCGPTTWHERRAMRISVSSWATTDDDVERCLEAMLAASAQ